MSSIITSVVLFCSNSQIEKRMGKTGGRRPRAQCPHAESCRPGGDDGLLREPHNHGPWHHRELRHRNPSWRRRIRRRGPRIWAQTNGCRRRSLGRAGEIAEGWERKDTMAAFLSATATARRRAAAAAKEQTGRLDGGVRRPDPRAASQEATRGGLSSYVLRTAESVDVFFRKN